MDYYIFYAALVNTSLHMVFIGDGMFYMPNGMGILRRCEDTEVR
jgi:hypothetical protein